MARVAGDQLHEADALRKIGAAQWELPGMGDSAITHMKLALDLSKSLGDAAGIQSAAKNLALCFAKQGDHYAALRYVDLTLGIAEERKDEKAIASALVTKGNTLKSLGRSEEAATTMYRAIEVARHMQDTARILDQLNNLGNLYLEMERFRDAQEHYQQMQHLAIECDDPESIGEAQRGLAFCWQALGRYDLALAHVDSALDFMQAASVSEAELAGVLNNKGDYLVGLRRYDEALDCYSKAILWAREGQRPRIVAYGHLGLGRISIALGDPGKADSLLHLALQEVGKDHKARMDVLQVLGANMEAEGRLEEALAFNRAYIAARDSFINLETLDQMSRNEMRQRYKADEDERAIGSLSERISQQQRLQWMLGALIVAALAVAVLAYRNWRAARTLHVQAEAQHLQRVSGILKDHELRILEAMMRTQDSERTRIARDLHDRVGALLSSVKLQFSVLDAELLRMSQGAGERAKRVADLMDRAVSEVRTISHALENSHLAAFGLEGALKDLCGALDLPGRTRVELHTFGLGARLDKRVEVAAYHIIQEAISNALKHARATQITVQVTKSEGMLNLLIEDDGAGFEVDIRREGMGLRNLSTRALSVGGTLNIDSRAGRGTVIIADLPLVVGEA